MNKNTQFIFPKLPSGLTQAELRKEIRRRLQIADELGLIRKPRKLKSVK